MDDQVIIREATAADIYQVCESIEEVHTIHCEAWPEVFVPSENQSASRQILEHLKEIDSLLLVAEHEGQVVGHAIATMTEPTISLMRKRSILMIDSIGVKDGYRELGIGKALLENANAWGLSKGAVGSALSVWSFNQSAIDFYLGQGYAVTNLRMWKDLGNC